MTEQRQGSKTAALILEALRMKRAFNEEAALKLLRQQLVPDDVAKTALADRYERRIQPGHSSSSPGPDS